MFHNTKGQDSGKVRNNFRKGDWCKKQLLVLLLGILGGCYAQVILRAHLRISTLFSSLHVTPPFNIHKIFPSTISPAKWKILNLISYKSISTSP